MVAKMTPAIGGPASQAQPMPQAQNMTPAQLTDGGNHNNSGWEKNFEGTEGDRQVPQHITVSRSYKMKLNNDFNPVMERAPRRPSSTVITVSRSYSRSCIVTSILSWREPLGHTQPPVQRRILLLLASI